MQYLAKDIYFSALASKKLKAIAFAIFVKASKPASVLKDMSYRQIADLTRLSHETCRRRIAVLRTMKLVEVQSKNSHHYFFFKPLRAKKKKNRHSVGFHYPKHSDIDISKLDTSSVTSIEQGLMALCPVEIQIKKELARQLVKAKQKPRNASDYKKASRICSRCGYDSFDDDGISYKHIASILHCSYSTVSKVIQYGVKNHFFKVIKSPALFMEGEKIRYADEIRIIDETQDNDKVYPVHYTRGNRAFYQPANRFELPRCLQPRLKWK